MKSGILCPETRQPFQALSNSPCQDFSGSPFLAIEMSADSAAVWTQTGQATGEHDMQGTLIVLANLSETHDLRSHLCPLTTAPD
jgi:hypothetical protein